MSILKRFAELPDLRPGESVTTIPDRYCEQCEQARGVRRCPICGTSTVLREDLGELRGLPELEQLPAELEPPSSDTPELEQLEARPPSEGPSAEQLERAVQVSPPPDPEGDRMLLDDRRPPKFMRVAAARAQMRSVSHEPQQGPFGESARRRAEASHFPEQQQQPTRTIVAAARRPPMSGIMQQREMDSDGREVHATRGARNRRRSAEEELVSLWEQAKIDKARWSAFAAAFASGGMAAAEAADAADALYMELIERERLATAR